MKTIQKLIIFGVILFLGISGGFFATKAQTFCSSNATLRCVGNSVFWYDSCGKQQSWVKDCFNGCQNGQCINPQPSYVKHFKEGCSNGDLYWYDSNGTINDLYKSCSDNNECTKDSCLGNKCVNEGDCKNKTMPSVSAVVAPLGVLDISVFCGIKDNNFNFSKNITVVADQTINCLVIVKNTTTSPVNDITVRADIPTEIINTSELKIDGLSFNGNITSGINIGNFTPNLSKIITFEGKVQSLITQVSAKQTTGIISSGNLSASDSLTINFQPIIAGNITAPVADSSPFVKFLKRWYIWILSAIVLFFLFLIIFKRVSSNI